MTSSLPIVLVPGLLCSARLYAAQVTALWPQGQVAIADHRRDSDMAAIAAAILSNAPERFALAGLSMGGYIAFAMMRLAPERIARLALLDTSARPDLPEQTAGREKFIALAEGGKLSEVVETLIPRFLHRNRANDEPLKNEVRAMAAETVTFSERAPGASGMKIRASQASWTSSGTPALSRPNSSRSSGRKANV